MTWGIGSATWSGRAPRRVGPRAAAEQAADRPVSCESLQIEQSVARSLLHGAIGLGRRSARLGGALLLPAGELPLAQRPSPGRRILSSG